VSHAWATNAELDPATLLRTTRLIRSSGLGAMLLQELVGGYDRLDLRQMFEPLIALLENSRIAA
jgi:hypothetical protein